MIVLTQSRSGSRGAAGIFGETPGRAELLVRSGLGMLDHLPEVPLLQVWISERFTARQHGSSRHPVRLQGMHGVIVLVRLRPGAQDLVQVSLMLSPGQDGGKPGILRQLRLADGLA